MYRPSVSLFIIIIFFKFKASFFVYQLVNSAISDPNFGLDKVYQFLNSVNQIIKVITYRIYSEMCNRLQYQLYL